MTDEIGPRERNEIRPPSNRVTLLMSQICIYTGYVCLWITVRGEQKDEELQKRQPQSGIPVRLP